MSIHRALRARYPLMLVAVVVLLAAMWGGLVRIGWALPPGRATLVGFHGPLMVAGFLGTLIAIERAVAIGRPWTLAGPVFTVLGALALIIGLPAPVGPALLTLGSLGLVAIFAVIVRRAPALYTATMAVGAVAWLIGNALWLAGLPLAAVVLWWVAFLVLTIGGERLELSRLLQLPRAAWAAFLLAVAVTLVGAAIGVVALDAGVRVAGVGLLGLALWLLRYDIARRTARRTGLPRYVAICLLSGYVWLGVGGIIGIAVGGATSGPHYDAFLHAVFLGFVFAMVFAHAPIIIPAVLGQPVPYRPAFYAQLVLLDVSLVLRVVGDMANSLPVREWGGMLNVVAILLFLGNTALAARSGRRA